MNHPKLSIVMPVFNHPDLVIEMVGSIRRNSFEDWELLMVDDGSSDDAYQAIADYVSQDVRIKYQCRDSEPKGAPTCRNIGFSQACGEYLAFFDSDDYIAPYCLGQRVAALEAHPELDFMVFRSGIYRDGRLDDTPQLYAFGYPIYRDDVAAFCARSLPFIVWNNLYRRSSLERADISWDVLLLSLQDADFNIRAIVSGLKYAYSDSPADYAYRLLTSASVSKRICSKEHIESNLHAVQRMYQVVQQRYGHLYDQRLYRGLQYVYVQVSRDHYDQVLVSGLKDLLVRYSPKWSHLFRLQMAMTRCLMHLLPYRRARQIPMFGYLLSNYLREKTISDRISKTIKS